MDNESVKPSIHFLHMDYFTIDHIYFIVRPVSAVNAVMVLAVLFLMVYFFEPIKNISGLPLNIVAIKGYKARNTAYLI